MGNERGGARNKTANKWDLVKENQGRNGRSLNVLDISLK